LTSRDVEVDTVALKYCSCYFCNNKQS